MSWADFLNTSPSVSIEVVIKRCWQSTTPPCYRQCYGDVHQNSSDDSHCWFLHFSIITFDTWKQPQLTIVCQKKTIDEICKIYSRNACTNEFWMIDIIGFSDFSRSCYMRMEYKVVKYKAWVALWWHMAGHFHFLKKNCLYSMYEN